MRSIKTMMNMKKKSIVITGGGGHIAYAAAEALAELGGKIFLIDSNDVALSQNAERLSACYPKKIEKIQYDLEHLTDIPKLVNTLEKQTSQVDVLINMAAFVGTSTLEGWVEDFEKQTLETWKRALDVNLSAVFELSKSLLPLLRASNAASIINIGSTYGILGPDMQLYEGIDKMGNPAAYAASKGGVLQLTRWLATVLAPDLRVNAITPGGVFRNQDEQFCERYIAKTPMKRMATEEDFKGSIAYLASDLSRYVTGQNLIVDGGWSVW